jgi:hypothetical protein
MDTDQIDKVLRSRSRLYRGTFASDELVNADYDDSTDAYFIVNTEPKAHPGSHWIAIYIRASGNGFYFDTYGRKPPELFRRFLNERCIEKWTYNDEQIQSVISKMCGAYCIQYVILMENSKHDFNKLLELYSNDTALNDYLCKQFLLAIHG